MSCTFNVKTTLQKILQVLILFWHLELALLLLLSFIYSHRQPIIYNFFKTQSQSYEQLYISITVVKTKDKKDL